MKERTSVSVVVSGRLRAAHRQVVLVVVAHGHLEHQRLAALHRVGQRVAREEGLEAGERRRLRDPQAGCLRGAHCTSHPLSDGVGDLLIQRHCAVLTGPYTGSESLCRRHCVIHL